MEVKTTMGDRTFTAEDVIRIYRDFLDEREMETVEKFFEGEPVQELDLSFADNLLERLEQLLEILAGPIIGTLVAVFSPVATVVLREANQGLRDTNTILSNIVQQGGVDA